MKNKIIKITLAQIIMWAAACLADAIQNYYFDNHFIESICLFIMPICLLIGGTLIWRLNYSCKKNNPLIKRMFQHGICFSVWWLETYLSFRIIAGLIESDKWIIHNHGFVPWGLYFYWAILAAVIPVIVIVIYRVITWVKQEES